MGRVNQSKPVGLLLLLIRFACCRLRRFVGGVLIHFIDDVL